MNRVSTPLADERSAHALARGLGWFSIALGLAELLAPRSMARATGLENGKGLVQAYGLREIGTGIGILASRNPAPWMWARTGGDALDLLTLAAGAVASRGRLGRPGVAIAAVLGAAAADYLCARALQRAAERRRARIAEYGGRGGLSQPPDRMRGAAREDFQPPADMVTPPALRPLDPAKSGG